jgi:hypothetical protein
LAQSGAGKAAAAPWPAHARKDCSKAAEAMMNEDVFNTSIRKFLKTLGVTAQREIEKTVRQALAEGRIKGNEKWHRRYQVLARDRRRDRARMTGAGYGVTPR